MSQGAIVSFSGTKEWNRLPEDIIKSKKKVQNVPQPVAFMGNRNNDFFYKEAASIYKDYHDRSLQTLSSVAEGEYHPIAQSFVIDDHVTYYRQ